MVLVDSDSKLFPRARQQPLPRQADGMAMLQPLMVPELRRAQQEEFEPFDDF